MQEISKVLRRRRIIASVSIVGVCIYAVAMFLFWTVFSPSWLPNDIEDEFYYQGGMDVARAEIRGIGVLPLNNWLGFYLARVIVRRGNGQTDFVLTDFREDGTCSFTEFCDDGRIIRRGRFHPLKGTLPMPQSSEMIEGKTFDSSGNVIGHLENGEGTIDFETCKGERYRVTLEQGYVTRSIPLE